MPDKKDQQKEEEHNEENFTGSPEQQLPDLEAEDKRDETSHKEPASDKHKEE